MNNITDFYVKELQPIVNGTIICTIQTPVNKNTRPEDMFYGLKIKATNGTIYHLWFLRDDEGNGCGAFDLVNTTVK